MLLATLALQPLAARADSACWPEEKLIGTSATGFVEAYKLWALRADGDGQPAPSDAVPTYARDGRPGKPLRCEDISTFNGGCHDDYAYVPLWGDPTAARVQARTTAGEPVWLQLDAQGGKAGRAVLATGRHGELVNPDDAALRATPDPKAAPVKPSPAAEKAVLAFMQRQDRQTPLARLQATLRGEERADGWQRDVRVLAFAQRPDGLWMQLAETWAWSPPDAGKAAATGPVLRTGWLRHRNADGQLLAVVKDGGYCD